MNAYLLPVITLLSYSFATLSHGFGIFVRRHWQQVVGRIFCFLGLLLHAMVLHYWIDLASGQNLTFFNLLSLGLWLVSLFALFIALFKSFDVLVLIMMPLSMVSIILVLLFPGRYIIQSVAAPKDLFHIVLSIITFSVLCLAGLQAVFLAIQDRLLRYAPNGFLIRKLPPLVSTEKLFFQMVLTGFILLTFLLFSSLYSFHPFLQQDLLISKTLLAICAWLIFLVLLLGRWLRGWRGRFVIFTAVIGVLVILFIYLCSKFFT